MKLFQTLLQLYESVIIIIIIRFGNESEQDVDGSNNLNKRLFGCIIKGFRNRGSDARTNARPFSLFGSKCPYSFSIQQISISSKWFSIEIKAAFRVARYVISFAVSCVL